MDRSCRGMDARAGGVGERSGGGVEQFLPGFEEYMKPKKDDLYTQWEAAGDREKRSRTMFAQEGIKADEVAKELPPKVENVIYSPMSEAQQKIYEQVRQTYRNSIIQDIESKGLGKSTMRVLEGLTKLRQVACHPNLVDGSFDDEAGKFEALKLMIDDITSEDHKVLVFSQFVRMLTIMREHLEEQAIDYSYLDGSTKDREGAVNKFQNDEHVKIFLI